MHSLQHYNTHTRQVLLHTQIHILDITLFHLILISIVLEMNLLCQAVRVLLLHAILQILLESTVKEMLYQVKVFTKRQLSYLKINEFLYRNVS